MTNSLKKSAPKPTLQVIELERQDTKPLGSEKELRAHILSLQGHPGFEELLRRARVTRAILEARLRRPEEDEYRHSIRAGIEAYGFLERQLKQEIGRPVDEPREPFEDEQREYERISQHIQLIQGSGAN